MPTIRIARLAAALVSLAAAWPALAQPYGAIDPNTFILGHPASPRWVIVHSNDEHPAVAAARLARQPKVDPNLFIVQPPASVRWVVAAPPTLTVAKAPQTLQ